MEFVWIYIIVIESLAGEKPLDVACTCSKMQEDCSVISTAQVMRSFLELFGGTNNLHGFFFHLFQVTVNKHSENGKKEKQQQTSGKGNTFSGSVHKQIKVKVTVQPIPASMCSARHSMDEAWILTQSLGVWAVLLALKLREQVTACFIYYHKSSW